MTDKKQKTIRDGFGDGLVELGKQNQDVVALTADLASSLKMVSFAEKYPERFIEVGIAEQNMAGVAAGLALSGRIPYMGTFSSFQPMRNLDQIRTSICIMNAPVKIVSSHGGFSFPADGIQIQALEDIGIMRSLPNMNVVVPADYMQAKQFTKEIAKINGPVYLRIGRSEAVNLESHPLVDKSIYQSPSFGKLQRLRGGGDGIILATGYTVDLALQASAALEEKGFHFSVGNLHTIKPIDSESIIEAARATGKVITVEEHQIATGVGSAVAEVLLESGVDFKQKMIGVKDQFGETARSRDKLWETRGLTVENILAAAQALIS